MNIGNSSSYWTQPFPTENKVIRPDHPIAIATISATSATNAAASMSDMSHMA